MITVEHEFDSEEEQRLIPEEIDIRLCFCKIHHTYELWINSKLWYLPPQFEIKRLDE